MTPNNGSNGQTTHANGRKRPSQGRVVPAIPLPLSKPRPSKVQPKAEADARGGAAQTTPRDEVVKETTEADATSATLPATDNVDEGNAVSSVDAESTSMTNGVRPSTADTPVSRGSAAMSLSNGATPEQSVAGAADVDVDVATPPSTSASNQTALVSPPSARKPIDKFDMRPIRTELPPAFVPSAERQAPQSGVWSAHNRVNSRNVGRAHHPSTSSIVFGGHESPTASPALPQSARSGYQSSSASDFPPLGATRPPPQPSQPAPTSHAHHVSEPFMPRGNQYGYPPPPMWNGRQGYPPPMHAPPHFSHQGYTGFRYPPREIFTPSEEKQPNGYYSRSRSGSHASSAPLKPGDDIQPLTPADDAPGLPKGAFMPGPPQLRHHHPAQRHHQPPQFEHPEDAVGFENGVAMRAYLQTQFANPLLADCHLQITEDESGGRQYLDAHKILLARSPTLLDLIQSSEPPQSASLKTQVAVSLKGRYVVIRAFMDSVQYLYGGPLRMLSQHPPGASADSASQEARMERALQLVATGAWLKVPVIAARAMDVIFMLLHWNTIPAVLGFAMEGGLGSIWAVEDGSEMSCSSSDDSLGRADGTGPPAYDPYATDLLHRVIDFTVHMLPPNFYLDASAPQLASCPRLPTLPPSHESRPSRSDPRLSQIRFGEIPSEEDHTRPSRPIPSTISSLLLSLPFALLKCVLEHNNLVFQLGPDTVASIMRQVVAERETRRKKVLQARPAGHFDDVTDTVLIQNMYFEEEVEPSVHHRAGCRLARKKRGIDTPPSSGAASERRE